MIVLYYHTSKQNDYYYHILTHIETVSFGFSLLLIPKLSEELMNFFNNNNDSYRFCMNTYEDIHLPMKGDNFKGQVILSKK